MLLGIPERIIKQIITASKQRMQILRSEAKGYLEFPLSYQLLLERNEMVVNTGIIRRQRQDTSGAILCSLDAKDLLQYPQTTPRQ